MATNDDYVFGIPGDIYLHPDELRCPQVQFLSGTSQTCAARSQRLYLSIYPWAELTYCVAYKPQPVGETSATW